MNSEFVTATAIDIPHCIICSQLAQAEERYLCRLRIDRQMRCTLTDALVASMGFCEHHWLNFQEAGSDTAIWSNICVSDATARVGELFSRTKLQDEFLQDLLFGARSRCPACLFRVGSKVACLPACSWISRPKGRRFGHSFRPKSASSMPGS